MLYFDTSFLVPLILPEASSSRVSLVIHALPPGELAVSHWTRVEFSSLVAREVRMRSLDAQAAAEADANFETMLKHSFEIVVPTPADFAIAKDYLLRFETGLRAGDALHLAIAANRRAGAIYTLDRPLAKAGKILGLPMSTGPG